MPRKAVASNGRRSSMASPMPTACTGRPKRSASATTTPPWAVPSSLVTTRPLTSVRSRNASACACAFWPVVASSTSKHACGADGSSLRSTRRIFASSSISSALLCNPAGSVDEHDVDHAAWPARGLEREGCGVGPRPRRSAHRCARPRSTAARPRRHETCRRRRGDVAPLLAKLLRELADRGRLAAAVDADDQHHEWPMDAIDRERTRDRRENGRDLVRENHADLLRGDVLVHPSAGERRCEIGRRPGPRSASINASSSSSSIAASRRRWGMTAVIDRRSRKASR